MCIYIYIQVAKEVRTVPVRGLGTEKCDCGNCASPHPHPPPPFFRKSWKAANNYGKNMKTQKHETIYTYTHIKCSRFSIL